MKSISLLTLVMLTCGSLAFGQLRKGNIMITGGFSYNRNPDPGYLYNFLNSAVVDQTNAYASIGYLLGPRFAMGFDLNVDYRFMGLDQSQFPSGSRIVETNSVVTPGIFVRTFIPLSEKFMVFVEGGYGLGFGNSQNTTYPSSTSPGLSSTGTSKTNMFRLKAGLSYFITNRFALEVSPGAITWSNVNPNYGESTRRFNAAIGLRNLTFGIVIYLGRAE